jgi:hypothetical protein
MDADARSCPHCKADLRGERIPQEYIDKGYYNADDPYYYRTIGVEVRGVYDGVLLWQCPDCGGRWHRWPEGHYLRDRAEKAMLDNA